ncbi:hypothetical protein Tco_0045131 [Tanacetum coccineum]
MFYRFLHSNNSTSLDYEKHSQVFVQCIRGGWSINGIKQTFIWNKKALRILLEEELRIKERNVKEKRNEEGKSSSPGKDSDAESAKIRKNGSDYDITISKSSHDKDKTAVQWSNNELFQNDFYHNHEVEKRNEDNKVLKEANNLLTKELKMYKERLQILGNKPVNNTVLKKD